MAVRTAIVTEYFAAASDDVAALALLEGQGPSAPAQGSGEPLFETVPLPGIEPFVMLGTLHHLLSGRPYRECAADARHGQVVGGADEGPWVVTVSASLVDALADASRGRLADVAGRWARTPELRRQPHEHRPERLASAVLALASLAYRAREVRHSLYCWTRLPS
ncbi:hypothetical protein Xcel_1221 [Xylanimonas cellulosilytica DSM 15894]|uniref:Uncharacterized protein n=1 Tax=Xylanimonas cellulosilytica (strain DSM 15894 / JCM 12276 / CECT 5975 / KCTC 9989 / LMG 20990 / NBRC 107835 / XIL07) TaxID=446471 RepID=D1C063_XYLCX|nr:hypothetical protein [Xylanimonas cellulosilytica]ACZ30252.1 hypothetical protein Xcel_1221 [Xylanimonas cellulosilytica DSM 15894]